MRLLNNIPEFVFRCFQFVSVFTALPINGETALYRYYIVIFFSTSINSRAMSTSSRCLQRVLHRVISKLQTKETTDKHDLDKRKRRKMYPLDYRLAIVQICRHLGNSIRGTAALVQPSAASISRWMRQIESRHARGAGSKPSVVTDLMLACIKTYIFENSNVKATTIKVFLKEKFQIDVSRQLVQLILSKKLNYSYKRTRKRGPNLTNDPEFKSRTREYVTKLHAAFVNGQNVVSVDESGFDHRSRPLYGYAPKGKPAIVYHPKVNVPHVRTSLILAIASNGQYFHQLESQTVKGDTFADFILAMPFEKGSQHARC